MDLEGMGPTGFQDLAGALLLATFGPQVTVMGLGRDGGRDMHCMGPLEFKGNAGSAGLSWDGYTVFQVKHRARISSRPSDGASWLWTEIKGELDEWATHSNRGTPPKNLMILTNVGLSASPGDGGHDQIRAKFENYAKRLRPTNRDFGGEAARIRRNQLARISKIENFIVWDRTQLEALVNLNEPVRRAFKSLLTPGDVLAALPSVMDRIPPEELEGALRDHSRTALLGEGLVYFDEAGGSNHGVPVHEIAIDLPVVGAVDGEQSTAIGKILDRAERVLKPSVTNVAGPRHLVLTGAPGNGKTTVSKFVVQMFRSSFLGEMPDLSLDQRAIVEGTNEALRRMKIQRPQNRRWPMRIDLAEYARDLTADDGGTLLRWIARRVSQRSNAGDVSVRTMQMWIRQWPSLVVADGLDEVSDPAIRKTTIQHLLEFVNDSEADDSDILVVVTTRPLGYTENISPSHFVRLDLDYLEPAAAVRYGETATRVRLGADLDRIEKVVIRLRQAADDESLRNLLITPLQVLIVTIILEGSGRLAPDRYSLFWGYYETIFRRELAKIGGYSQLLSDYGPQIQELHERVGFELQARSEAAEHGTASLSLDELRDTAWSVLRDAGFILNGTNKALLENVVTAATHRLVLIAPKPREDGFGFDVRSLQELMAGMYLSNATPDVVMKRLALASAFPHWRNSWVFAAGRTFAEPRAHEHQALVELIESIDDDAPERLGRVVPIGPRLALDVIDDGMTRSRPKWQHRILEHALRFLFEPQSVDLPLLTRALVRHAQTGDDARKQVADGLRAALGGDETSRETALAVQREMPAFFAELDANVRVQGLTQVLKSPNSRVRERTKGGLQDFEVELETNPHGQGLAPKLDGASAIVIDSARSLKMSARDVIVIANVLEEREAAIVLEAALVHAVSEVPKLAQVFRDTALPPILRQPIGSVLRSI